MGTAVHSSLPPTGYLEGHRHHFAVRIHYTDTDAGGVVYHARYLDMAERARTEMMRLISHHETNSTTNGEVDKTPRLLFAVRAVNVAYHSPARLDDSLAIVTEIIRIGGASLDLRQTFYRLSEQIVTIDLQLVVIDATFRPVRINEPIRSTLAKLCPSHNEPPQ